MDIIIDPQKVTIQVSFSEVYCMGSTKNALGNLIMVLENDFPEIKGISGNEYGKAVLNRISNKLSGNADGKDHVEMLWGLEVSTDNAYGVLNFADCLEGNDKIKLTMKDVEVWRIRHFVEKTVSPLDWINASYDKGIRMDGITSIYDIVYALLFYYALNELKLAKCEHCGRWFATESFKRKYCNQKSPVPKYTHLNCEQAVENIRQQCARVRNGIDAKARLTAATSGASFQQWFWSECTSRTDAIKKAASAEKQMEYLDFLEKTNKSKAWLDNSYKSFDS